MPKSLLVVSPHFFPSNTADSVRVHSMLPYLEDCGWRTTVVCVDAQDVDAPMQKESAAIPPNIDVHRVRAPGIRVWNRTVPRTLGLRALVPIAAHCRALLSPGKFDLCFFTTTQFEVLRLGPRWLTAYDLPYVLDIQDLWYDDFYRQNKMRPPGGHLKYGLAMALARGGEKRVVSNTAGIVSTSRAYPEILQKRYPNVRLRQSVEPFPALVREFDRVISSRPPNDQNPGQTRLVYVGRGGDDLRISLCGLFSHLRQFRDQLPDLKLEFIGTSYSSDVERTPIADLANDYGIPDLVSETPRRIPLEDAIEQMLCADALLLPGSVDSSYQPSKLANALLAKKPLLYVGEGTPSLSLDERPPSQLVAVDPRSRSFDENLLMFWRDVRGKNWTFDTVPDAYTPRSMTDRIARFFDVCAQR